jgi:hypothetical protein
MLAEVLPGTAEGVRGAEAPYLSRRTGTMAESERGHAVDAATAGVVQGPRAGALPPGLPWPPIAQLIRWWRRPVEFFEGCARRYGDVFTIRFPRFLGVPGLPGSNIFIVFSDPDAVREVFTGDSDLLKSGEANRRGDVIIGPGSLLLLGR